MIEATQSSVGQIPLDFYHEGGDGAYSNQSITKKLAQSFGIGKKSAKKPIKEHFCNKEVNLNGYVSNR